MLAYEYCFNKVCTTSKRVCSFLMKKTRATVTREEEGTLLVGCVFVHMSFKLCNDKQPPGTLGRVPVTSPEKSRVTGPVGHYTTTQTYALYLPLIRLRGSMWPTAIRRFFLPTFPIDVYRCYLVLFVRRRRDVFVPLQLLTATTIIAAGVNLDETNNPDRLFLFVC